MAWLGGDVTLFDSHMTIWIAAPSTCDLYHVAMQKGRYTAV